MGTLCGYDSVVVGAEEVGGQGGTEGKYAPHALDELCTHMDCGSSAGMVHGREAGRAQ